MQPLEKEDFRSLHEALAGWGLKRSHRHYGFSSVNTFDSKVYRPVSVPYIEVEGQLASNDNLIYANLFGRHWIRNKSGWGVLMTADTDQLLRLEKGRINPKPNKRGRDKDGDGAGCGSSSSSNAGRSSSTEGDSRKKHHQGPMPVLGGTWR